jgi:CHAD domain-containing protein
MLARSRPAMPVMNAHSKDASVDLGAALHGIADDQLSRAGHCLGWQGGHRHKGVHQARKSIRRVRSILALAGAALGPGAEALTYLLSEINQGLSRTRDAQALVEAIDHLSTQTHDQKWLAILGRARRNAVTARHGVLREALAADPDLLRARGLLMQTKAALEGLPWDAVTRQELEAAFSLGREKTRQAAKKAGKTGDDEDWHRWRRKARRQSQQQRILAEAGIESIVKYDDKDIATLLGKQQDCSLLLEFCQSGHSPIRWTDRNQLNHYVEKKLASLRKELARQSVAA